MMRIEDLSISPHVIDAARRYHLDISTDQDQSSLNLVNWQPCHGGLNNGVYSLENTTGKYCFKFFKVDDRQRAQREWAVLHFLFKKGFKYVPQPLYREKNDQAPLIIMEFIEGKHLGQCSLNRPQLMVLVKRIKEMHAIAHDVEVEDLGMLDGKMRFKRVKQFMQSINPFEQETRNCLQLWERWEKDEDPQLICESIDLIFSRTDTNLANCLWDGCELRFVDWEYGGWTEKVFDLAEQVEHGQSRGTPDAAWEIFIEQFDLNENEHKRYGAAQRLMAFFWATLFWPSEGVDISARFINQVERVRRLCAY